MTVSSHSPLVVKLGGSTLDAQEAMLADVVELFSHGTPIVVVHGGGLAVSSWMERLGLQPLFKNGVRVTDAAALEVVRMVLAGSINQELVVVAARLGAQAIGLTGLDGGLLHARQMAGGEFGLVGEIVSVRPDLLMTLLEVGYLPIVAPLATALDVQSDGASAVYNINADSAAGAIATAMAAHAAVFLTDVPGIRDASGNILRHASAVRIDDMITSGVIHRRYDPQGSRLS